MDDKPVVGWLALLGGMVQLIWVAWQMTRRHRDGEPWLRATKPDEKSPALVYAVAVFVSLWCIALGGGWIGLWF